MSRKEKFSKIPLELRDLFKQFCENNNLGDNTIEVFELWHERVREVMGNKLINFSTDDRVKVRADFSSKDEKMVSLYYARKVNGREKLVERSLILANKDKTILEDLYNRGISADYKDRILPDDAYKNIKVHISKIKSKIDDQVSIPIDYVKNMGYVFHILGPEETANFRKHYDITVRPTLR